MLLRSMGCYPRDLLPKTVFTTPELNRSEAILRSITIDVLNVRSEQTGRRRNDDLLRRRAVYNNIFEGKPGRKRCALKLLGLE
jgi:hypothetical protein